MKVKFIFKDSKGYRAKVFTILNNDPRLALKQAGEKFKKEFPHFKVHQYVVFKDNGEEVMITIKPKQELSKRFGVCDLKGNVLEEHDKEEDALRGMMILSHAMNVYDQQECRTVQRKYIWRN